MAGRTPTTTAMSISDARARLTTLVNDVYTGQSRIVVEKSGIPVAAVVSPSDLAKLERLDQDNVRFLELLDEMQAAFADVPEDELMEQALIGVAEVREEMRAEATARAEVQAARESRRTLSLAAAE